MKNEIAEVQEGFRAVVKEAVEETALRELETIRTEKLVVRGLVDEANAVSRARSALGGLYWPNAKLSYPERGLNSWVSVDGMGRRS